MTFDIIIFIAGPIQNFLSRRFYFGLDSSCCFFKKEEILSSFQNERKNYTWPGNIKRYRECMTNFPVWRCRFMGAISTAC